jgi:hypothetical protein
MFLNLNIYIIFPTYSVMKKTFTILLIFLLILPLVFSQINDPNSSTPNIPTNISKEEIKETVKEKIKDPTPNLDDKLDKELELPGIVKALGRYIIGVKDPITLSKFIIGLFIYFFFAIIFSLFGEIFQEGNIKWAIAFVLSTTIAITGVYNTAAVLLLNAGQSFKFLEETSSGTLLFWIIIIVSVLLITKKITKKLQKEKELAEAEIEGREIGTSLGFMKSMRSWFKWGRKVSDK